MLKEIYNDNFSAMGTRFGIVLPGVSPGNGNAVSQLIKEGINRLENKISRFIPAGKVSYLNRFACKFPVAVDEELWNILKSCFSFHTITYGTFDITLRALADFWNHADLNPDIQDVLQTKLDLVLSSVGMNKIELNEENRSIFFRNKEIEIDLGAIGKGLALKYVNDILIENEIENAFISFGESSILALGSHPNGNNWKIGIPDYLNRTGNAYTLEISNYSISTSGNTHNNRIAGRVNIINPFTGMPVRETKTILVADKDPVLAEVFSTSFMILDDKQIQEILSYYPETIAVKVEYMPDGNYSVKEYRKKVFS